MARPPKINEEHIQIISRLVRLRLKWKQIAGAIGVDTKTIRNWIEVGRAIQAGIQKKKGLYLELVEAIDTAKVEMISDYSGVVRTAACEGAQKTVIKVKELTDENGVLLRKMTERTITQSPPDARLALKVLAIEDPTRWGEVKQLHVDWRASIQEAGVDPQKIEKLFFQHLLESDSKVKLPIPKVSDQEA